MIEYLENTKREILTHVDTRIEGVRFEMKDIKDEIIDIVDTKIESVKTEVAKVKTDLNKKINSLSRKMTKEFKKVNGRLDILEREARKAGWDLSPDSK